MLYAVTMPRRNAACRYRLLSGKRRRELWGRFMRVFISLIVGIIALVLSVALVIFAMQNIEAASLHFLPYSFTGNIAAVIVGSAILGFVVAILLMTPGRIAEILHDRHMTERMEQATGNVSDAQRRQA